jgi:hypothetical protein
MVVRAVGQGAGTRPGRNIPNLLRVFIGETAERAADLDTDEVWTVETNLDDTTAEVVADAGQRLMAAGALDVFQTAVMMKKGRSGIVLTCLVHDAERQKIEEIIFEHTGTFGLRRWLCGRSMLHRRHETVTTPYGPVRLKLGRRGEKVVRVAPEFEDCRLAAEAHGVSVQAVMQEALRLYGGSGT